MICSNENEASDTISMLKNFQSSNAHLLNLCYNYKAVSDDMNFKHIRYIQTITIYIYL